jgi:endogenous inhibitor of DNA gyrase (YacG/DUF329 family)
MKEKEATYKCRYCGKVISQDNPCFPFCREKCRMADLGSWILGDPEIEEPSSIEEYNDFFEN